MTATPNKLKTISDPPPLLYVRGDVSCLTLPQLAIVGSRNPSPGGKQNAHEFAKSLSKLGIVITSGMASGIDASAHIGALEADKPTIAICAQGLIESIQQNTRPWHIKFQPKALWFLNFV
ncbi:Rossmann fold nucleotide-binding protein Smf possibly involved in DNA uptake [uncultured Gammaproteobacteria bacterium]|nr:Rossmann fold nucleotide-binding protein Smf possibly involved in DNA uptake [uncultured Gammaproteobacteria bacterium]